MTLVALTNEWENTIHIQSSEVASIVESDRRDRDSYAIVQMKSGGYHKVKQYMVQALINAVREDGFKKEGN